MKLYVYAHKTFNSSEMEWSVWVEENEKEKRRKHEEKNSLNVNK